MRRPESETVSKGTSYSLRAAGDSVTQTILSASTIACATLHNRLIARS
jgi:hypothetical protein